ncbi:restriction endonuclease subunit S [Legionella londiniensis]|uniref:Putative type I restriction-modification system (Methylase S subunit) n=1 Tax=Legionella londiniensis TaxID=45068 RepID=A0A0W0VSP2_9GAMM|nr:restriction endonuclease subunit S [Legionella londiniensis]KTD23147.1 putative type I restriction-modification system (methylase S subunit) [Legionella londiniensis]STX93842.1 type I restriction-modification system (methylase_S) [Legionella londiniensis]
MKQYPGYKKSEKKWLNEIPEHWNFKRAKSVFKTIDIRSIDGSEELLSVSEKNGVALRKNTNVTMFQAESYANYKLCWPQDLVINSLWAWMTGLGFSEYHGIISTAYSVFRIWNQDSFNYKYGNYLLRSKIYNWEFRVRSKGIWRSRYQLSDDSFLSMPLLLPPLEEQQQITRYLDWKTARINKFIKAKKKLITLLKEQKQNIISEAVTKGVNSNVEMKDSEIEWLGEIPRHWIVKKIRHFCSCQNGISESGDFFTKGYPFISYGDVYKHRVLPNSIEGKANSNEKQQITYSVQQGDIFFTRTSEALDEVGITSVCLETIPNAIFSGFLIRVRPNRKIINELFSKYYFQATCVREYFTKEMNIVTRASLGQNLLKNLPVLLPPYHEQLEIAEKLEEESKLINATISRAEKEIELIQEYKTRLISDVVTGKIDVRSVAIPDFDPIETDTDVSEDNVDERVMENME